MENRNKIYVKYSEQELGKNKLTRNEIYEIDINIKA